MKSESESHSVMSDSLRPHGPYSPWNSPGKNTFQASRQEGLSLLQGIFPTQGSNPGLLPCRQILYHLSHQESSQNTIKSQAFPSLGDLPNPGIKPRSPALQADSLPAEPQVKPYGPQRQF